MLTVLGGLAEFERDLIRARTGEGQARAAAGGQRMGRPPKLTPHQKREAIERRDTGSETLADIGRNYNVSAATISRLTAYTIIADRGRSPFNRRRSTISVSPLRANSSASRKAGRSVTAGQRISPSSIYVLSGTMKARSVGVGQSKWIIHDTARAMSCRSLPFGTSPSAPPFSGEHGGPMPIARVRKPVSARVRAASYPAWPIVIEPGSGSLCASESIKLLLRAFRPSHNDEIAVSLRRKNFEGGPVLHDRHSNFFSCFHGRSLPQCEEPGPKLEETLSCGAAGWPGGTANRRGPARELLRPRRLYGVEFPLALFGSHETLRWRKADSNSQSRQRADRTLSGNGTVIEGENGLEI